MSWRRSTTSTSPPMESSTIVRCNPPSSLRKVVVARIRPQLTDAGLEIRLEDTHSGLRLLLSMTLDPGSGVIARRSSLSNLGQTPYHLDW